LLLVSLKKSKPKMIKMFIFNHLLEIQEKEFQVGLFLYMVCDRIKEKSRIE